MKEEIFVSTMGIFMIFNIFYLLTTPGATNTFLIGGLLGIVVTAVGVAIGAGISISIFGSSLSLSDASIKIIFVSVILLNILYQVNIYGFTVGLGLATNIINVFSGGDIMSLGSIVVNALSLMALFSGVLMVAEDS